MTGVNLAVNIAGIAMKNPVMAASGTFGFGREYAPFVDLNAVGAVVVKGLTLAPRHGNPGRRIVETPAGILNAIGLQNPGIDRFISEELPFLARYAVPVIVNVAGNTVEEYGQLAARASVPGVAGIEVNISCPNVKKGGLAFGADRAMAAAVIRTVRQNTPLPVIAKLSPNVTDVTEIARAVVDAGADAISLINTLLGMAIDIHTRRPKLGNIVGGLSGPAVRPVAVRMVWQVARAVKVPVIGMGGIMTGEDAVEFMLAGASAVAVGTASFVNPRAVVDIAGGIAHYLRMYGIASVTDIVGKVNIEEGGKDEG